VNLINCTAAEHRNDQSRRVEIPLSHTHAHAHARCTASNRLQSSNAMRSSAYFNYANCVLSKLKTINKSRYQCAFYSAT